MRHNIKIQHPKKKIIKETKKKELFSHLDYL